MVAQITPWKAQDDAIRALAQIKPRHPKARLLLVGSAKFVSRATRFDNRAYLRELERLTHDLGLTDSVTFLGEREDVPELLRASDLLLAPSWDEPFGRCVAEGMAMRLPVIATAVGGPAEIVEAGTSGLLLPPRSPDAWAEQVDRLLADPEERARLGAAGRTRVATSFSVDAHVAAVLSVYREALGHRPEGAHA
jgi:L-malate glycosyltransferase